MSLTNRRQVLSPLRGLDRLIDINEPPNGNKKMVNHIEHVSSHSSSPVTTLLNKRKVNQKICEWYESWSEWQRKVLICGLTNICSTTQLESFATSLEPIFHRDFVTQLKQQYPSGPFKKVRPVQDKKSKKKRKKKKTKKNEELEKLCEGEVFTGVSTNEIAENHDNETKPKTITDIATGIIDSALQDAIKTVKVSANNNDDLNHIAEATDILGNLKLFPDSELPKESVSEEENPDNEEDLPESHRSMHIPPVSYSMDEQLKSEYHNALSGLPFAAKITSKSFNENKVQRQTSFHNKHYTTVPSSVSTVAILRNRGKHKRNMQAQIKVLNSVSPLGLHNADLPVQNMFKSINFFGDNPRLGTTFIRPEKGRLNTIFQEQLQQIWHWLESWQGHERLALLAMIMKMSSTSLLTYMAQCLYQRLQERININWLPDNLLLKIFSYLPAHDVDTCSKVCRRWQYVCSQEELWISKCKQMGKKNGIQNIVQIVRLSNKGKSGIDWKMAYSELKDITKQTKNTIPVPKKFNFESTMPDGIWHFNGKLLPRNSSSYEGSSHGTWESSSVKMPVKGLGMKLARESEKLKQEYRKHLKEEGKRDKLQKTVESSKEELEPLIDHVSVKTARTMKTLGGSQMTLQRAKISGTNPSGINPSLSQDQLGVLGEIAEEETVAEWIKGQKQQHRKQDNEGEQALDVRHNLVQAKELLGKAFSSHALLWRDLSCVDDYPDRNEKYGGLVRGLKQVRKLMGHMDSVLCCEYDRRRLISGSMDRSVRIWDIKSGRTIHKLLGHKGSVTAIAFNGALLYTGSWDMTIMVWDLVHFERITVLTGHRGSISALKIAGNYLVSASHDGSLRFWNRKINKCMKVIMLHKAEIMSMVIDDDIVITGSSDCTIKFTDLKTFKVVQVIPTLDAVHRLIVQEKLIITCNVRGQITFWNRETGESEAAIQAHSMLINSLSYYEGRFLSAANDGIIKEWDLLNLTCLRSLRGHKGGIQDLKVDDKFAVSCDSIGTIRIWEFSVPSEQEQQEDVIKAKTVKEDEVKLESRLDY